MKQFFDKKQLKEIVKHHWLMENGVSEDELDTFIVKEKVGGCEVVVVFKSETSE
jgi:predicted transglutaminase-like cysteine proteinase